MWTVLGIPNCDSVRRTRNFLETEQKPFEFRDIRKNPLSEQEWRALIAEDKHNELVNTRGTTFRKSPVTKEDLNDPEVVVKLLMESPTVM